jgi:hypothetical protein
MAEDSLLKTGRWLFVAGAVIAIVLGAANALNQWAWILVLLGIVVGLLALAEKESNTFFTTTLTLMVAGLVGSQFQNLPQIGTWLSEIFRGIMTLTAPAAIIVALKEVYLSAQSK